MEAQDEAQGLEYVPTAVDIPPQAMVAPPYPEVPQWGTPPAAQYPQWAPPQPQVSPYGQPDQPDGMQLYAKDTRSMLGVSIVALAIGAGVGYRYGGLVGGLVGFLGAGAAVNTYRAVSGYTKGTPEDDAEAKVAGTFAVVGAAAAGGIAYKWWPRGARYTKNEPETEDVGDVGDLDESSPLSPKHLPCGTRRVGP